VISSPSESTLLARAYFTTLSVETYHLANSIAKAMFAGVSKVIDGMLTNVHTAGRHLVEQRLPNVCAGAIDESDPRFLALTQAVTDLGDKFQSRRATADHNDIMQQVVCGSHATLLGSIGKFCWRPLV
jgi:hypothetical protein